MVTGGQSSNLSQRNGITYGEMDVDDVNIYSS